MNIYHVTHTYQEERTPDKVRTVAFCADDLELAKGLAQADFNTKRNPHNGDPKLLTWKENRSGVLQAHHNYGYSHYTILRVEVIQELTT